MDNISCNLCGDALAESMSEVVDSVTGESFSIHSCTSCSVDCTNPFPNNCNKYYGASYYGGRHGFTADLRASQRVKLLCTLFPKREGMRLLDIGCGDGAFMGKAKQKGWIVTGTEINPDQVIYNKENVYVELEEVYENAPYDCITFWHSIEHLKDPLGVLEHVRNLLQKDGVLLIAVPNSGSFQAKLFGRHWLHLDVPRHLYHFNLKSLKGLLKKVGFTITHDRYGEVEYDILGWSQSFMNCLLPQSNLFFKILSYKTTGFNKYINALILACGGTLSILAIPFVYIEKLLKKSGTLVVIAKIRID